METNKKNANRMQTTLNLVSDRVLPVVVNNFRNKLIGVVLAGLVLPQMAYAGHGGGGGGNKGGGGRSGGMSAARSMSRPSSSNFQRSANSFKSSNSFNKSSSAMKSFTQKSNFQNGGTKQFTKKSFGGPIPAKNGNTGINGSGLPDRVIAAPNGNTGFTGKGLPSTSRRPFPTGGATGAGGFTKSLKANSSLNSNAAKISGNSGIKSLDKSKSWKQFRDNKVTKSDKGIVSNAGIKTRGDFDKVVTKNNKPSSPTGPILDGKGKVGIKSRGDFDRIADVLGKGQGGGKTDPGTGGGMGQGGDKGNGGGNGKGNGKGGGKHGHHHGFPWWAFVTPQVVNYPSYPVYCEPVYQQPVYYNTPVYTNSPVVDQAPVTPVNYPAPTEPAPATTPSQPVNANSDGYVDLVLEDVEYLEPATLTVGPLYLVKVRNQGTKLSDKFRIGAFAQLEGEMSDDAPRSVTEVPNLGAGETASVTLRLPSAAMQLISTSSAGAAAFNQLLVVVDLDDSIVEIEKSNNVANLDRAALEAAAAH